MKENHLGYRDAAIDRDALDEFDADGNVKNNFVHSVGPSLQDVKKTRPPTACAVAEVIFTMGAPEDEEETDMSTADFGKYPILSIAFPTLFPRGVAEFALSRSRAVHWPAYVEHLLKFKDWKSARHPTFRFVVYNMTFHRQVNSKSRYFAQQVEQGSTRWTTNDLRAALVQDEPDGRLLQTLFRHDGSIRGTPPYWAAQRLRVEAMTGQIGIPSLFVSFSSGEMHWQSFARLFPDYSE